LLQETKNTLIDPRFEEKEIYRLSEYFLSLAATYFPVWCKEGLGEIPEEVLEDSKEYFEDRDPIGRWITENIVETAGVSVTADQLLDSYNESQRGQGDIISRLDLVGYLKQRWGKMNYRKYAGRAYIGWTGYRIQKRTGYPTEEGQGTTGMLRSTTSLLKSNRFHPYE